MCTPRDFKILNSLPSACAAITAYLTNCPSSEGFSGLQSLQGLVGLEGGTSRQQARMQPTLPQSTGAADMDLPSVQSVEWLFKKERMYLLAQFWQQVREVPIY